MPIDVITKSGVRLSYPTATDMKLRGSAVTVWGTVDTYAAGYSLPSATVLLAVVSVDAVERVERVPAVEVETTGTVAARAV